MTKDTEKKFEARGVRRGNILLLPSRIALEFLEDCRKRGTTVLGFDAFRLISEREIQPVLEHSIDVSLERFTSLTRAEKMEVAEKFIREQIGSDLLFEMITDDPDDQ